MLRKSFFGEKVCYHIFFHFFAENGLSFFCQYKIYLQMLTDFTQKNGIKYECEFCDFRSSSKNDYSRHILTRKHQKHLNTDKKTQKNSTLEFSCLCGKVYKHRQSLFAHKNKCQNQNLASNVDTSLDTANTSILECKKTNEPNESSESGESNKPVKGKEFLDKEFLDKEFSDKDLIKLLIKENSEFKNVILEIVKSVQPNNTTNNNTTNTNTTNNNSNNHFNLQFFLNDTCKDALNLVDFVDTLQVQLKDLEETAKLGYSEGVSRIFINGLNKLDVTMRPIHCSDAKRETLYIKDQDEWTKEEPEKTHLSKAIKSVSSKNIQQIFEWQKKYPEYKDPMSRHSDKYMKMIMNTMSGSSSEEQSKNLEKIIKNITKQVIIDKN